MSGWIIVAGVVAVFALLIWGWHALDRKHMRDSIREADEFMARNYGPRPGRKP